MSNEHVFHIDKLKRDFENIISLKNEIIKTKIKVSERIGHLKTVYQELVKTNTKKIFLFCLDSFFFQYKSFVMETDNIDRFRIIANNRMYCDYYKLYNIILSDIKDKKIEINMENIISRDYPIYKDLEPYQEYKIDDIKDLHTNILSILNELYNQSSTKIDTIDHYNDNHRIGFSISNFINTLQYENRLLRDQISLYVNYMSFFHISQKKQLRRLSTKMNEFFKEVDENINDNRTFSIEDIEQDQSLDYFYNSGEDISIKNMIEDSSEFLESSEVILNSVEQIMDSKDATLQIDELNTNITFQVEDALEKDKQIEDGLENPVTKDA